MGQRWRGWLLSGLLAAGGLLLPGCDFTADTPDGIYDDVGELDINARERLYTRRHKDGKAGKRTPRKHTRHARLPEKSKSKQAKRSKRKGVPAPAPAPEYAARRRGIDKYTYHHASHVGEIELEY